MAADWSRSETISDPDEIVITYQGRVTGVTSNGQLTFEKKEVTLISTPRSVNTVYHGPITYTDAEGKSQTREIITRKTDEKRTTVAAVNPAYISWRLSQGLGLPSGDVWNLTETTYEYSITTDGPKVVREQVSDFITEWQLAGSLAIKKYNNYEPTADQFESNRTVTLNDEWTGTDGRTISRRRVSRWIALGLISEGSQSVQRQIDSIKFFLSKTEDVNGANQKAIVDKAKKLIFEGTEVQIETGKLPVPEMPSGADRIADEIVNGSDTTDLDGDGIPDWAKYDPNDPFDVDTNGDGISDWVDLNSLYEPDERRTNNDFTFDDQLSFQAVDYDSATGLPLDPVTSLPVKAITDFQIDPATGRLINPSTGQPYDPPIVVAVDPVTGKPLDDGLGLLINPATGQPYNPPRFTRVDPDTGSPIFAGDSVTADYEMPFAPDDTIEFVDGVRTLVEGNAADAAERFGQAEAALDYGHAYGQNIVTAFGEVPSLTLAPVYVQMAGVEGAFLMDSVSYAWGPEGMVVSSDLMLLGVTGRYGNSTPSASWLRVPVPIANLQQINATGTVEASPQKANSIAIPGGFDARNPAATLAALPTNGTDVFREWRNGNQLVQPVVRVKRTRLITKATIKVREFPYSLTTEVETHVLMTQPVIVVAERNEVTPNECSIVVSVHLPTISTGTLIQSPASALQVTGAVPFLATGAAVQLSAVNVTMQTLQPDYAGILKTTVSIPLAGIAVSRVVPSVIGAHDPNFSSVSLLLHMNGANNSTVFTDSSSAVRAVTNNGNAKISTDQSVFGSASGYFDGSGDFLTIADNAAFEFGSGSLTWEFWIKTSNSVQYATLFCRTPSSFSLGMWSLMMNHSSSTSGDLALYVGNFSTGSPLLATAGVNVRDNAWHHVAVVRNVNTWSLYVDGTSRATGTWTGAISDISASVFIGRDQFYIRDYLGYMDELRITKGVARYTANFTPPALPFPDR